MSLFSDCRIKNDLENLTIPIEFQLIDKSLNFQLNINTPIYKGNFNFLLIFPEEYPFKSPKLFCKTKVFHPNIFEENVCLKVLREGWLPSFDVNSVVVSILCMFYFVSGEDALNTEAGELFEQNYPEFLIRTTRGE
jgi:ubiquitin-conjugating enzyme E2 M